MKKEEMLSQEEIDALMQVFSQKTLEDESLSNSDPGLDEIEPEVADSSTDGFPKGTSRESGLRLRGIDRNSQKQNKQFERISELLSYSLVSSMSEFLRRDVVLNRSVVEKPVVYGDFLASMNNPSCIGVLNFQEIKMTGLLELDLNLSYTIIDMMLGGKGDDYLRFKRALTDLELKLIKKPIERILLNMNKVLHLKSQLEEVFTYPSRISINPSYEIVVPLTFNVAFEESTSEGEAASSKFTHRITFCIPKIAMESHFINQNTVQSDDKEENKYFLEAIKKSPFIDMPLRLQAHFSKSEITIGKLIEMKIGDTIVLDANNNDVIEVELLVEECPKFKGKLGAIGRYKAVEIISAGGF